jgi:S-methylmethionine-dependent homocysteine/selenocysteine methylase
LPAPSVPKVMLDDPTNAPSAAEAEDYHVAQAQVLANAGVDFLHAPTFPSAEELLGISRAFARTKLPYILSPGLSHEELDKLDHLEDSTPEDFADHMFDLHARGIKILGGCCGTSEAHIRALAQRFTPEVASASLRG